MTLGRTDALGVTRGSTKFRFLCHFPASKETSNILITAIFRTLCSRQHGQPTAASTPVRVSPSWYLFTKRQDSLIVAVTQSIPVLFLKAL
jgi:hypothetical protein